MNTALLSGLKKILKEYGTGVFDNIKFVGSALSGNAAAKAQPECDVLMLCFMADYHKELIGADETVRDSVKKSIAERLHNNEGIDADLCNNTLDILEAALFGNEPEPEEKAAESGTSQTSSVQENMELTDTAAEIKELRTIAEEYKEQNAHLVEKISRINEQNHNENFILTEYLISVNNQQSGPYSLGQIQSMIQSGQITLAYWVCREGSTNWVKIDQVPEINVFFTAQMEQQDTAPGPRADPVKEEADKDAKITRMAFDIERLTQERDQNVRENFDNKESLNKTKAGLIAAIVIGVTGLIISIAVGYGQYSSVASLYYSTRYDWDQLQNDRDQLQNDRDQLQKDKDQLQNDKNQLQKDRDQLQIKYDALIKDFTAPKATWVSGVNITSIKAGNVAQGGQWLTNAGNALYASQMRYLAPVITYNSLLDIEITFYIKIIEPNGNLLSNSSISYTSPTGYTYSTTEWVHQGNNQTLNLSGWGNSNSSSYSAGQWTVEVWHNNACLRSEKVTINP